MNRQFCDRCLVEVTGKPSSAVFGVEDADTNGDGPVTHTYDHLCEPCYTAWLDFMRGAGVPACARRKRRLHAAAA